MRLNLTSPRLGVPIYVGPNVFIIKTLVAIGGGTGKLSHKGLRQRFLNLAKENKNKVFQTDDHTNNDMLEEEIEYFEAVQNDSVNSFNIDTTTTIVKLDDGSLVLHSPAEATPDLKDVIDSIGNRVSAIIAPNLQHWLGCASWAELYPEATVYVAPAAEGECLVEKLDLNLNSRVEILEDKGSLFDGQLPYSLLKGAPLMLNEVVFFHKKSSTLIVADAFYSGHNYGPGHACNGMIKHEPELNPPNVFTRIWFKLTKDHWCSSQLPSYRTTRVLSNGNPEVLISCIRSIIHDWAPKKMICAHGDRVIEENPGKALIQAWINGVLSTNIKM